MRGKPCAGSLWLAFSRDPIGLASQFTPALAVSTMPDGIFGMDRGRLSTSDQPAHVHSTPPGYEPGELIWSVLAPTTEITATYRIDKELPQFFHCSTCATCCTCCTPERHNYATILARCQRRFSRGKSEPWRGDRAATDVRGYGGAGLRLVGGGCSSAAITGGRLPPVERGAKMSEPAHCC